jgi:hypothetical protein
MTRKTVRITQTRGVILFFEIGPGRTLFREREIGGKNRMTVLVESGMYQPNAEAFIPNGRLHHRI